MRRLEGGKGKKGARGGRRKRRGKRKGKSDSLLEGFEGTGLGGPLNFDTFGCDVFGENPDTPDLLEPDIEFVRDSFHGGKLLAPNGEEIEVWGFEDPSSDVEKPFPSEPMIITRNQIAHSTLKAHRNTHTIHHHGIEPTTMNDGVGHVSFEVKGSYTYQFQPRHSGTYFYHCHKNTTLHFEMGMYGVLLVVPSQGALTAFEGGPSCDAQAIWVFDDIDPAYRELGHSAGLCGEDVGLNDINPTVFVISGVPADQDAPRITDPAIAPTIRGDQKLLVRLINGAYGPLRVTIGDPGDPFDMTVVNVDSRALGGEPGGVGAAPWSKPFPLTPGKFFDLSTAQRYDIIVEPRGSGVFPVRGEFQQWVHREVVGVAETQITVG